MAYSSKFILFLFVVALLPILIQAQTDKNQIIVSVSDMLGSKISEANVILFDGETKIDEKKTDKQGKVSFQALVDIKYRISISANGFKQYSINDINLEKNGKQLFEIVLEIEPITVDVSVAGNEGVDSDNFGRKTIIDKEEIDKLPDDPELFLKRLLEFAGVKEKGDIVLSVNGVVVTEIPPKAKIKQIRINRNIFSAQYEGTSNASIEITTSSFVEKIEGYFNYQFSDSILNASNPFLGKREPFRQNHFRGGVTIPTGKKTSISFDARYLSDSSTSTITATALDGKFSPILLRETFSTPKYNEYGAIEFNSDRIKNHQIIIKQEVNRNRRNGNGVGGFNLQSRSANSTTTRFTTLFSDVYTPNPNFFSQTTFVGNFYRNTYISEFSETGINVTDSFFGGGGSTNEKQSESKLRVTNDSVRKYGNFTIGFGGQFQWQRLTEASKSNFNGTYIFTGKNAPQLDSNNLPILDSSGNYVNEQISSLESYRRTLIFQQNGFSRAKIRELGGGAEQFTIAGGSVNLAASQTEYAFYQQNSFGISETFGLSFGLRYENQSNIASHLNFSPRIGFIWSPKQKDKQKLIFTLPDVRGGFGIFYSRFGFDNILNFQRINDSNRFSYIVNDVSLLDTFPNTISVSSLQQLSVPKSRLLFDEFLETPRRQVANISISKRLSTKLSLQVDLTFNKATRLMTTTNINSPLPQTYNFATRSGGVYPFGTSERIINTQSIGKSNSTRMYISLNVPKLKLFKKQTILMNFFYAFDKSKSNVVNASSSPFNSYDFQNEYATDENDGVHSFYSLFNYSLPRLISINGIFNIRSGSRFNIITGQDTNGDGFYSERPAFSNNPNKIGVIRTKYGLLDSNPSANDILIPRNFGRGALQSNFDLYINKRFGFNGDKKNKIDPKQILDIGLNVTNVFNSNNKGIPIANISSPNFLQFVRNSSDGIFKNDPRRLILSASFYF
jgi:hypothetical protein